MPKIDSEAKKLPPIFKKPLLFDLPSHNTLKSIGDLQDFAMLFAIQEIDDQAKLIGIWRTDDKQNAKHQNPVGECEFIWESTGKGHSRLEMKLILNVVADEKYQNKSFIALEFNPSIEQCFTDFTNADSDLKLCDKNIKDAEDAIKSNKVLNPEKKKHLAEKAQFEKDRPNLVAKMRNFKDDLNCLSNTLANLKLGGELRYKAGTEFVPVIKFMNNPSANGDEPAKDAR